MNLIKYLPFFFFGTFKFMFTPLGGPVAKLTFLETFLATLSGGYVAALIFFYSSDFFMRREKAKRLKRYQKALINGTPIKRKKAFTRFNKTIVKIKSNIGIYMICWLVPLFLSVPLGSIICAKFYRYDKRTIWLILGGLTLNCFIITLLVYTLNTVVL